MKSWLNDKYKNEILNWTNKCLKKKSTKELHNNDETKEEDVEKISPKKRYISPGERQQIIEEWRLVPKKDAYF